jgi:hypothetical protein
MDHGSKDTFKKKVTFYDIRNKYLTICGNIFSYGSLSCRFWCKGGVISSQNCSSDHVCTNVGTDVIVRGFFLFAISSTTKPQTIYI